MPNELYGPLLSMMGGSYGATNQHRRQKALMGHQLQNQMALNKHGHELQYDMWKRTNYPAQVRMLKEAGLNPALLYGMSGGGGTTTGSQGGGSAQSGSAQSFQPMDMSSMLVAEQLKESKERQAKLNAETKDILGETEESRARIGNLTQDRDWETLS